MIETIFEIVDKELPKICWKCGMKLVFRVRGLYCPRCCRFRVFIKPFTFHLKRRRVCPWSRVDVRESGRQRRRVLLPRYKQFI